MKLKEDYKLLSVLHKNRIKDRSYFMSYNNIDDAISYDRGRSHGFTLLNGLWKFHYAETPELAPQSFYENEYDVSDWGICRSHQTGKCTVTESLIIQMFNIHFR